MITPSFAEFYRRIESIIMRVLSSVFLVLVLLVISGCGSPSGPSTPVEAMGIQANLPGTNWHKASTTKTGTLTTEKWENADGTEFFRVTSDLDEVAGQPRNSGRCGSKLHGGHELPASTRSQSWHIQGTFCDAPGNRCPRRHRIPHRRICHRSWPKARIPGGGSNKRKVEQRRKRHYAVGP